MAAMPDSKFLLTISDAESWYQNYVELPAFSSWNTENVVGNGKNIL